jgi:hypothetical protein
MLAAHVMSWPEFALSPQEATALAEATANVLRHYDIGGTARTFDYLNLVQCAAMIYGTRIYARIQETKTKPPAQAIAPENVGLHSQQ